MQTPQIREIKEPGMSYEFDLNRRSMLHQIAALIGATALPLEALAAPRRRAAVTRFLIPANYRLLIAIADTLVPVTDTPGALAAKVPEKLDGLLRNWASSKTRVEMNATLAAIDAAAMTADKKSFTALAPERRKAVLIEHEKAALKPVPRKEKLSGLAAMMGPPSVADAGYYRLKSLVVALFYNSEIAMTKEVIYEHNPGKWVPSLTITSGMRPFAGTGGPF
jgi:gluconate 2-dehydrogenase gamma chain